MLPKTFQHISKIRVVNIWQQATFQTSQIFPILFYSCGNVSEMERLCLRFQLTVF